MDSEKDISYKRFLNNNRINLPQIDYDLGSDKNEKDKILKTMKELQKKLRIDKMDLLENQIPYIIDDKVIQIESRKNSHFENCKRYVPLNMYELSTITPRAIDLNSKVITETKI